VEEEIKREQEREKQKIEEKEREAQRIATSIGVYKRALNAFCVAEAGYYHEMPVDLATACPTNIRWFIDETFVRDGRIFEIKNDGETTILMPDGVTELMPDGFVGMTLIAQRGFLADGNNVWVCGCETLTRRCPLPKYGESLRPIQVELGALYDIIDEIGVKLPPRRYRIVLHKKTIGKNTALGILEVGDVLEREKIESAVKTVLKEEVKRERAKKEKNQPFLRKNIRRTVMFYDGDRVMKEKEGLILKKNGLIFIPRTFSYSRYRSMDYRVVERERAEWDRLREIAEMEEQEERRIATYNRNVQQENERKAKEEVFVGSSEIYKYLEDCELVIERAKRNYKAR
jgi:hypothetical protein